MWFVWKKLRFSSRPRAIKLGTRGHWALLQHSPIILSESYNPLWVSDNYYIINVNKLNEVYIPSNNNHSSRGVVTEISMQWWTGMHALKRQWEVIFFCFVCLFVLLPMQLFLELAQSNRLGKFLFPCLVTAIRLLFLFCGLLQVVWVPQGLIVELTASPSFFLEKLKLLQEKIMLTCI